MKRLLAAACAALILFPCGTVYAENMTIPSIRETIQAEQTDAFTFRNGVQWGMTPEQVQGIENIPMTMRTSKSSEWSVMLTSSPVQVSRFTADLVYMFHQNQLKMITYEFQSDGSMLSYQYLTGALCSVYGESWDPGSILIKALMDRIYPDRYRTEWIREARGWTDGDGTAVYQYYFSTNSYAILYVCPELGGQNSGYDVNGL